MITKEQQAILADIFANSTRPDKMTLKLNAQTREVTIVYEDLDEEWFKELVDPSYQSNVAGTLLPNDDAVEGH